MATTTEGTGCLLTVAEVAERCRVDPKTVRRWIATKQLPAHRLGRVWRVSERDLRRFLNERWSG
jgi:excisionase family DNA binding protein